MKTKQGTFKRTVIIFSMGIICMQLYSQKVVFLHHSTGGNVYSGGNVAEWINNYNSENSTNIEITERAYPNSPYPWANYPYDYWNLWIDGNCDEEQPGIECIENLVEDYRVIIFKHCFPGASIKADAGDPSVSSESKTLGNYKLQYRALREMMAQYPENLFIVWTLAPLHRLATNPEDAARAGEFVDWVKEEWLTEEDKDYDNIKVFDFWGYVAEKDENPGSGEVNCLKYDYEKSHSGSDSHPNSLANETIGPLFAEFIVNSTLEFNSELTSSVPVEQEPGLQAMITVYPCPSSGYLQIACETDIKEIFIYDLSGRKVYQSGNILSADKEINISHFDNGHYTICLEQQDGYVSRHFLKH